MRRLRTKLYVGVTMSAALAGLTPAVPGCGQNTCDIFNCDTLFFLESLLVNPPLPPPTGETVSFSADIQPILTAKCVTCHRPGGFAMLEHGVPMDFTEREQAYVSLVHQRSSHREDLTLVVPGDSANSLLFLKVSMDFPPFGDRMPMGGPPLSPTEIGLIRDWIDQGALNN